MIFLAFFGLLFFKRQPLSVEKHLAMAEEQNFEEVNLQNFAEDTFEREEKEWVDEKKESGRQEEPFIEEEESIEEIDETKTSVFETFLIFLKSYLGSGIMAMASTYLLGGVFLTTFMIFGIAILSIYCFTMLFQVRNKLVLSDEGYTPEQLSFEKIVGIILGKSGYVAVLCAVVFTQFGFSTAYIIFIAHNLQLLYGGPLWGYGLLQIPLLILLCWVRQMKWLSPFAFFGIFAIGLGVVTVVSYCFESQFDDGIPEGAITRMNWGTFPLAYGVIVYLFEGIGMVIPIERKMKRPEYFPVVMWSVHLTVATAVASFGLVGYLAFYHCTQGPIILNLPNSGPLIVTTVWSLNVALTFTYPIMMVPVFEILEGVFVTTTTTETSNSPETLPEQLSHPTTTRWWWIKTMSIRAITVLVSAGVGIGIPDFSLFLSLVGGLGSAQLMFIFPPLTYLKAFQDTISTVQKIACVALFVFGIFTIVVTTLFSVLDIIDLFTGEKTANDSCSLGI